MVVERVLAGRRKPEVETVAPGEALGRVLACEIRADRDYPPFDRSVRDGFAVRAEDLPGPLRIVGEVRAGQVYEGEVGPGEAVEIMTGAPVPKGADCVVMVEHTASERGRVTVDRA
ncbi:MAG: molybdopterin molybdenumtransferase MoeA, partial [Bryobacteraceae bacterium]|nr:molybdopterin molybdenumtransferase MoeA [Bryobacteraceae bacterium]